ncbi:hypothetical protein ACQKCJ_15670 [Flavobacterium sp. NPDC079362]|uniref:hypothetical protein n=1 Tax=Flavobacterium sp. NPDC079362 TaxID=3390566 RepID=UPI003D0516E4
MGNTHNYSSKELQKCPYHNQLQTLSNDGNPQQDANTGDWDQEREDDAGMDPDRNEKGGNNN